MTPQLSTSTQFDLELAKRRIPHLSREELEASLARALELALIREGQVKRAIKVTLEMQVKLALLDPPEKDLKRWLKMARELERDANGP